MRSITDLPQELLVRIFSYYVKTEGIGKLLKLVAPLTVEFEAASSNPSLWAIVDEPNLDGEQLLKRSKEGGFCCTIKLNLSYVHNTMINIDLEDIISQCPRLKWLDLSNNRVTKDLLGFLSENCPNLESLRLENVVKARENIIDDIIEPVLNIRGPNMTYLDLSNNSFINSDSILDRIAETCHSLKELHIAGVKSGMLQFPIAKFQSGCPRLEVLELGCCEYSCTGATETDGFRFLQTFLSGGVDGKGPRDRHLTLLLKESKELKVLDVRECDVTCECLLRVPSEKLEKLYVSQTLASRSINLYRVITKWKCSLKVLDLSGVLDRNSISVAISALLSSPEPLIENLDLSFSNVSPVLVDMVLKKCPKLRHLKVKSCREAIECVDRCGSVELISDYCNC